MFCTTTGFQEPSIRVMRWMPCAGATCNIAMHHFVKQARQNTVCKLSTVMVIFEEQLPRAHFYAREIPEDAQRMGNQQLSPNEIYMICSFEKHYLLVNTSRAAKDVCFFQG